MLSSVATCVSGRPLPSSSETASRLNSSVNARRVVGVIRAPRSLRSLSEVSTQPGEGHGAHRATPHMVSSAAAAIAFSLPSS